MLDMRDEHVLGLLPLSTGAFVAAQMSEELVWELFVQGGPIGETRITTMVSISNVSSCPAFWLRP